MLPVHNSPARYNPVPSQPLSARPAASAQAVNCPQWLYPSSISEQSLKALANLGRSGTADERELVDLFQRHLSTGPVSLKTPANANDPHVTYSAHTKLNGANVEVLASFALDANHKFELKELAIHDQETGKHINIKLPPPQVAPPSSDAQTSGSATRGRATRLNQQMIEQSRPRALDRRGNDVGATQRESSWAVHMLQQLSPEKAKIFLPHIFTLIKSTTDYKQVYNEYLLRIPGLDEQTIVDEMAKFDHADALKKSLREGISNREPAVRLIQRLADTPEFKTMLDFTGALLLLSDKGIHNDIRDQPFFADRGRTRLPDEQIRDSSLFDRHAGIAEGLHRRPSTENFFEDEVMHAKAGFVRDPDSLTARQFSNSGVPFISGASGSMQFILQFLEMQKPHAQRLPQERETAEIILLTHAALLVAAGHHSLAEALLPGRKLGYFDDLPDPLNGNNGYRDFMRALDTRLATLGMTGGVRLSAS